MVQKTNQEKKVKPPVVSAEGSVFSEEVLHLPCQALSRSWGCPQVGREEEDWAAQTPSLGLYLRGLLQRPFPDPSPLGQLEVLWELFQGTQDFGNVSAALSPLVLSFHFGREGG